MTKLRFLSFSVSQFKLISNWFHIIPAFLYQTIESDAVYSLAFYLIYHLALIAMHGKNSIETKRLIDADAVSTAWHPFHKICQQQISYILFMVLFRYTSCICVLLMANHKKVNLLANVLSIHFISHINVRSILLVLSKQMND